MGTQAQLSLLERFPAINSIGCCVAKSIFSILGRLNYIWPFSNLASRLLKMHFVPRKIFATPIFRAVNTWPCAVLRDCKINFFLETREQNFRLMVHEEPFSIIYQIFKECLL